MSTSPIEYLRHILDEIDYIASVVAEVNRDEFLSNPTLKRSFVRSIEIIGEASKKLPSEFREKYPDIDWRRITGMRDKLVHDYLGVDYYVVWDVAKNKLPELRESIKHIIFEYDNNQSENY
ncbi:MAG: DUF86 domain-containing protein [Sedimentisphaerales bacterium]|nr:DUF86 domain-containing protein [Sedimentisphaerales bacterium]